MGAFIHSQVATPAFGQGVTRFILYVDTLAKVYRSLDAEKNSIVRNLRESDPLNVQKWISAPE